MRFPVGRLAAALLAIAAGGSLAAGLIAGAAVGTFDLKAIALAGCVVLVSTGLGVAVLAASRPRPVFGWASLVLGASTVRLAVSLLLAFWVHATVAPDRAVFWGTFLSASLVVLIVETLMARVALLNPTPDQSATESA